MACRPNRHPRPAAHQASSFSCRFLRRIPYQQASNPCQSRRTNYASAPCAREIERSQHKERHSTTSKQHRCSFVAVCIDLLAEGAGAGWSRFSAAAQGAGCAFQPARISACARHGTAGYQKRTARPSITPLFYPLPPQYHTPLPSPPSRTPCHPPLHARRTISFSLQLCNTHLARTPQPHLPLLTTAQPRPPPGPRR